jgi:hypothetical protein
MYMKHYLSICLCIMPMAFRVLIGDNGIWPKRDPAGAAPPQAGANNSLVCTAGHLVLHVSS